jgi:hypothetical protein
MEVSRQLHTLVDLAQGNEPRSLLKRRVSEPNFHCGPGVDSASNRNEYQENFLGVKAADT